MEAQVPLLATFGFHKQNCFYINKWKRHCNYKLKYLFQTLSHPQPYHLHRETATKNKHIMMDLKA